MEPYAADSIHQRKDPRKERKYTRKRTLNQNMKTVLKNPWNVESIQYFSCLKCPECAFFTKEENYFENHAIKNHPLSAVFFDKKISDQKHFEEIEDKGKNKILVDVNHIDVEYIKKEPNDQDNSEYDPLDFSDTNTQQKEGQILIPSIQYNLSPKDQNDLFEVQDPFISKHKPKKRQRKQQISE